MNLHSLSSLLVLRHDHYPILLERLTGDLQINMVCEPVLPPTSILPASEDEDMSTRDSYPSTASTSSSSDEERPSNFFSKLRSKKTKDKKKKKTSFWRRLIHSKKKEKTLGTIELPKELDGGIRVLVSGRKVPFSREMQRLHRDGIDYLDIIPEVCSTEELA